MLMHCSNARRNGVARIGEIHRPSLEHDLAASGFVDTGHGLNESRFSGAVVTQQAMALTRKDIDGNTGKRDNRAEMLLDILHLNEGRKMAFHTISPR